MSYCFGDGFDCYAAIGDAVSGYWDSSTQNPSLVAGRFSGSRAISGTSTTVGNLLVKSSGVNDSVHHFAFAFVSGSIGSGPTVNGLTIQLADGVTNQCGIAVRGNGDMVLYAGTVPGSAGSPLATYAGAVSAANVWFAFEVELVIHNTAGSITVRRNGNTSNDFTLGSLNTRASANNYANKITIAYTSNAGYNWSLDDLLWRSDASSVPWVGDVRCYTRMPASDASVQFAKSPATVALTPYTTAATSSFAAGTAYYQQFTPAVDGTIGTAILSVAVGYTGNLKCAIFASSGTAPTTVLGSATPLVNPVSGNNTFTFGTPVAVTKGTQYWIGLDPDTSSGSFNRNGVLTGMTGTTPYASFPVANPGVSTIAGPIFTMNITVTTNSCLVNETLQDGTTTYVYDSTAGHADLYNLGTLASTPASVVAVTTRGFVAKSDAGTRTGAMQIKSSGANTWNPADLTNITLSGGNLIATPTAGGGVRSLSSATGSNKYYWEGTWGSGSASGFGVANSSAILSTVMGTGTGAAFTSNSGATTVNGTSQTSIGAFGAGGVCCIALDVGAQLIWFRNGAAGQWNGSGTANPATGIGGWSINSIEGTSNPIFALCGAVSSASAITANFGASGFTGAVPPGFTPGFPASATVASPTLSLSSGFLWAWRTDALNPATGTAWTPAAADAVSIGPIVVV